MALTLPVYQKLDKVSLITYFNGNRADWLEAARAAYQYLHGKYAVIRPDDVAKILLPVVEAHQPFKNQLAIKKLTQNYWHRYFVDLVIDQTWNELVGAAR